VDRWQRGRGYRELELIQKTLQEALEAELEDFLDHPRTRGQTIPTPETATPQRALNPKSWTWFRGKIVDLLRHLGHDRDVAERREARWRSGIHPDLSSKWFWRP